MKDSGQQVPAAVLLNWSSFHPPFKRPNADCPEEQQLGNRDELPHHTSRQKTYQCGPAGRSVPICSGARYRPPIFHVPDLLQMFQRTVSQNSLVPEIPICQSPHRPVRPAMGAYIGIAGRPAITKIDVLALGAAATAIDCAGWPKRSVSMAIRTFDLFLLRHKNHHLQMRIDDGAKASFSVKSYTNCSPGPEKAV